MTTPKSSLEPVHIVGAGLAGSEAAWQVAKPASRWCCTRCARHRMTAAHQTDGLAELVCSNSFRSDDAANNAVGLLHEEMRRLGSLVMRAADANQVPAGGALAVDRDGFSAAVTHGAANGIRLIEIAATRSPACRHATGARSSWRPAPSPRRRWRTRSARLPARSALAFFDAIAPIVHRDSIDFDVAWFQSRYDKAGPAARAPTTSIVRSTAGNTRRSSPRCSPAKRSASTNGREHALFRRLPADRSDGRARPRDAAARPDEAGRADQPARPQDKPYAIVQLRQDNKLGTLFNMVGFQTKLKHGAQSRYLPHHSGPRAAPSSRGSAACTAIHFSIRRNCSTQRCGSSASRGCASPARSPAAKATWNRPASACWPAALPPPSAWAQPITPPPPTTAHGALLDYVTGGHIETIERPGPRSFQPMNVNFGLFPPLAERSDQDDDGNAAARHRQDHRQEAGADAPARSPTSTPGSPRLRAAAAA